MLKDRKGPYPYPKRDVSKIPMFNYAEMDRQRQERAEQAPKSGHIPRCSASCRRRSRTRTTPWSCH